MEKIRLGKTDMMISKLGVTFIDTANAYTNSEERCPHGLPIRDMMEESANWYQVEKTKYRERVASR